METIKHGSEIWLIFGVLMLIPLALAVHIIRGYREIKQYKASK